MIEIDDDFEDDETQDTVVTDGQTGWLERKSDCVRQRGYWVHASRKDENPKTVAYRKLNGEE